ENTVASLISVIYQDINQPQDDQYFLHHTILSACNDDESIDPLDVDDIDALILQAFPGHEWVHHSLDSMV
ncbi:hypothetical protein PAXRUDRAFT_121106, partial [Paxillus rubicundulus Ve08.2h10]